MCEIAPKKKFGQNFLTDNSIIEKIISSAGQLQNKSIIEIGGGSGNLTKYLLAAKPKKLLVIEIDKDYIKILKEILKIKMLKRFLFLMMFYILTFLVISRNLR